MSEIERQPERRAHPEVQRTGSVRQIEQAMRPAVHSVRRALQYAALSVLHPKELAFYRKAIAGAYLPNELIDVVPAVRVLYVAVPKAACTRIRSILAASVARDTISNWQRDTNWLVHDRKVNGLQAPRHSILDFYNVATDPNALRFSIVRNPYDRLVSCWADQYRDRSLGSSDGRIKRYLKYRRAVSEKLPAGAGKTLSFPEFVQFATATADRWIDRHWTPQHAILNLAGVQLHFAGKMENLSEHITRLLDHVNLPAESRAEFAKPFHNSKRGLMHEYYTAELADLVYRTYERDFDTFQYPRALPS